MPFGWTMEPFPNALMAYRRLNDHHTHWAEVDQVTCDATFWRIYSHRLSLCGQSEGWCRWAVRGKRLFVIDGVHGVFEVIGFLTPPGVADAA
jgi:hypothetical protein